LTRLNWNKCIAAITVLWIISWFNKIELKQMYCSYSRNKKFQNDFLSFYYFWGHYYCWTETNTLVTISLFFFISFDFPPHFYCHLPYCSSDVPENKHKWKTVAANKAHLLKSMFPLRCANAQYHQIICAVKSHFCALATFQNIEKTKRTHLNCVLCSYFDKILDLL